ncbi:MAG: HypC/HybG/HupF family hydrogenase formation chaperone [Anaerolineae bacterium]|nr:HypC/HybG/HupF family hydrogenase formation chaperone [Anaerolineae bacterium]
MCLGIPGRIIETDDAPLMRMGRVDFGGIVREVCLAYVPEAGLDDYVIVHAGFAISRLDEKEAQETLDLLAEMGILEQEFEVT